MSDSPVTGEEKPERKVGRRLSPLSLLGWVMGGLSLLNLIEELSPLKVLGKLKTWLNAYTSIVNDVGTFLFGRIDFGWIAIDELEVHVLVIATILVGAYARADIREERSKGTSLIDAIGTVFSVATIFMALVFLPALLFPSWAGLLGAAIVAGLLFVGLLLGRQKEEVNVMPPARSFLRELIGVVAVFLILVALNYTVFR